MNRYRKSTHEGFETFRKVERKKRLKKGEFETALTKLYRTIWNAPGGDRVINRAINKLKVIIRLDSMYWGDF